MSRPVRSEIHDQHLQDYGAGQLPSMALATKGEHPKSINFFMFPQQASLYKLNIGTYKVFIPFVITYLFHFSMHYKVIYIIPFETKKCISEVEKIPKV